MAKALTIFNLPSHVASGPNHNRPWLSYRPMKVNMSTYRPMKVNMSTYRPMKVNMSMSYKKSYWTSIHEDIEAHLRQAVVVKEPFEVYKPMQHLVFAAPVNMAPALCVAACELVGGHREQAMAAAAALHVIHAAFFAHENLPLSDRPSLIPKSKPMAYHAFNPNVELLTGDGMIPFGLELLANSDNPAQNNSERILRVMVEITRAMGSQGMIEGQYNELQQQCSEYKKKEMVYDGSYKKKEGGLHACGAACGAILGCGSEEEIELLRRYGFYVGIIQGMSQRPGPKKQIEELKNLAIKEVKDFNEEKVEAISSFVENNFNHVL